MINHVVQFDIATGEKICGLSREALTEALCWAYEHPYDVDWSKVRDSQKKFMDMMTPPPEAKKRSNGNGATGKYCILVQWCDGTFYRDLSRTADTPEELVKMLTWDEKRFADIKIHYAEISNEAYPVLGSDRRTREWLRGDR